ncbi:MAG: hypothetical protein GXP56_15700 [Deltaproteobacteria bacterium]|nr:hypothetical protein [Deltaproteobacteria bacterium]
MMSLLKKKYSEISRFILSGTGLFFPEARRGDLEKGLQAAARELGFKDLDQFAGRLLSNSVTGHEMDVIVEHLTIGESFFFRDQNLFQVLKNNIFFFKTAREPAGKHFLTIWSAGCCSGEEPYSISMVLDQMKKTDDTLDAVIFATDINKHFLKKAKTGMYTRWSFRNTPDDIVREYFIQKKANRFELSQHIRSCVIFRQLNLKQPVWPEPFNRPGAFDLILFRNVLMYFDSHTISAVIKRFHNSLAPGGWLVVSPSETPFVDHPGLTSVAFPGVVLHRKGESGKENVLSDNSAFSQKGSHPSRGMMPPFPCRREPDKKEKKKEKDFGPSLLQHALDLYEKGRFKDCEYLVGKSLSALENKAFPRLLQARAYHLMAKAQANLGRLEPALGHCRNAADLEKLNPDHRYLLATIYASLDDRENEKKSLDQVLFLDPDHILAHVQLGGLARKQARDDLFEKHLGIAKKMLQKEPPDDIITGSDGMTVRELLNLIAQDTQYGKKNLSFNGLSTGRPGL